MKSNEIILKEAFENYKYNVFENIIIGEVKKRVLTAMNNAAIQQEEIISDILLESDKILNPLYDLWRKENSESKLVIPGATELKKWIVKKIIK